MIAALVASFMNALLKAGGLILDLVFTHVVNICPCLQFHDLLQFNLLFSGLSPFLWASSTSWGVSISMLPVGGKVKPGTLFKRSSYKYGSAQVLNLQTDIPCKSGLLLSLELGLQVFSSLFLKVCFQILLDFQCIIAISGLVDSGTIHAW